MDVTDARMVGAYCTFLHNRSIAASIDGSKDRYDDGRANRRCTTCVITSTICQCSSANSQDGDVKQPFLVCGTPFHLTCHVQSYPGCHAQLLPQLGSSFIFNCSHSSSKQQRSFQNGILDRSDLFTCV